MNFDSDAQKVTYEKILPWMKELFGIFIKIQPDIPGFGLNIGSAFVHISVQPWGEENSVITSRSYLVKGANITPDFMHFLLRENETMRFGAFGIDEDGDVFFQHTIVGSNCSQEDLKSSILAVGYTADQYDEKIVERWGGVRPTQEQIGSL
jgi:hypothetical protein